MFRNMDPMELAMTCLIGSVALGFNVALVILVLATLGVINV
jgi:hypothetical protein